MLQGFKNRTYNLGDKVRVYRNLNKGGWSILAMSGENKGRVVAHVDHVILGSVDFVISKAGLARAQASKVRNVHSYAQGILNSVEPISSDFLSNEITYNPFKKDYFYPVSNVDQKLTCADSIFFAENKAYMGMYSI
ncbi:hypothetical protein [Pseudoalteromonas sp. AC163]|jgi:hypothetical protein|uniref:hypothetical protein n=1 Tax=Pseudoalteromonas sp. AC163 TaxID=1055790 RepID=UPI000464C8B1|nr:hypothetical protein [Pseudoalteromonas sp. AC163]